MKPIVCVSSEGNDTKIVVLSKEKGKLKIEKAFSLVMSGGGSFPDSFGDSGELKELANFDEDIISIESGSNSAGLTSIDKNDVSHVATHFADIDLKKAEFIPVVSEPIVSHHIYHGEKFKNKKKTINAILQDIAAQKDIKVNSDEIDYLEIDDKTLHTVFIQEDNTSVEFINSWASYNGKRYYKISTIKNSETALAHYVAKTNKFFEEDYTLIIYTGNESSKLMFLKGNKLHHIGSPLDIGTKNIHTYDVYFSKILLEMENGSIPRLDNVILCGEDNSENLVLSFYGTFPEANVTELKFDELDTLELDEEQKENLSAFALPLVGGLEYFEEKDKEYSGINFLPKYIQENQKAIQFGWHSVAVLPFLFAATFFFTFKILDNIKVIDAKQTEIIRLKELKAQNELIVAEMEQYSNKISGFDETQAKLNAATEGTEQWGEMLVKVSDFIERRRNFWISSLESNENNRVRLDGFSLSRKVLTDFVTTSNSSSLKTIKYEPLRDSKTFAYTLEFNLKQEGANNNEP